MRKFETMVLTVISLVCATVMSYEVIDFEPPQYVLDQSLPAPWVVNYSDRNIISDSAISGSQSLKMINDGRARYPFTPTEDDTLTFSVTIKLPSYNPGNYDGGYASLGSVRMPSEQTWYIGSIYFELQKPYGASLHPSHRQIWFKNAYNTVANFVDAGTYTITYNINWATKTSVVSIVGDGGVDVTLTNQDNSINKSSFAGVDFGAPSSYISAGAYFDDFIIGEPTVAISGDFDDNGVVDMLDYAFIAYSWNSLPEDANWNAECNLDNTGTSESVINFADLQIFLNNWLIAI